MKNYYAILCSGILVFSAIFFKGNITEASCGSANCFLVTGTQEGIASAGNVIIDLSYRFIPMDRVQEGSGSADEALVSEVNFDGGEIEEEAHRELRTNNELAQLDMGFGINERFGISISVPFFNLRTHEHKAVGGEFSRQDGTSGMGDISVIGKYALYSSTKHFFAAGLGLKLPTGEYKLLNHEGEINEPSIQPGTGSLDEIISAYYAYQYIPHKIDFFVSGSYQIAGENNLDYQFGNRLLLNAGGNFRASKRVTSSLQINFRQSPHDEFGGLEVPSTGGKWVYITPGVKFEALDNMAFYSFLQIPIYQYVNEANIVPKYGLSMGMSLIF